MATNPYDRSPTSTPTSTPTGSPPARPARPRRIRLPTPDGPSVLTTVQLGLTVAGAALGYAYDAPLAGLLLGAIALPILVGMLYLLHG